MIHTTSFTFDYSSLKLFVLPFLALFLFTSCDSLFSDDERICTTEFKQSNVVIAGEGSNQPIQSVQLSVLHKESGDTLDICQSGACSDDPEIEPGKYIIFHDGYQDTVDRDGEDFVVHGMKGDSIDFSQDYTFGTNGCHIEKLAGPDTIFVSTDER